jgi:hypothetical protein
MGPVLVKTETGKCGVRDELMFAFLLAVNRLNEDSSQVEFARNDEFRGDAQVVLEQSCRICHKLQALIAAHCLDHRC